MKWLLINTLSFAVLFALLMADASANTYYIRTDGGTSEQCTGTTDVPYPGSGSHQSCAWSHPFWALTSSGEWKIRGGDTLLLYPGSYQVGYGAPNTDWCDPEAAYDCHLPPLPSGTDANHPTRIQGVGYDAGCASPPELWGTQRVDYLLTLENTSYAVIECLELTDHSACVEFHAHQPTACERDTYPFGDWAATGIFASDSSHVTLTHLDIHGLASSGVHAGRLTDWTVEDVRITGNGWVGWDGDLWDGSDSNSGTLTFKKVIIEWNGCAETYPAKQPDHCWDQSAGGYGDGMGLGETGGQWIFEECEFNYNTSDGLDLLYVGRGNRESMIEISKTKAVGNAGNPIKIAGPAEVVNSLMVGNCGFFDQQAFAQEMSDHCRAGGNSLSLTLYQGDTVSVVNNTIVGEGDALVEAQCYESSPCDGSEWVRMQNNIFMGYQEFLSPEDWTAFLWDPSHLTEGKIDYNTLFDVKYDEDTCPFGSHDICADPLCVDDTLDSFNGHLPLGSPAIDKGLPVGSLNGLVPADDLEGGARPGGNGVDMGAYEYGAEIVSTTTTTTSPEPCPAEQIYGEGSQEIELLRWTRDNLLRNTPEGQEIMKLYYQWQSPMVVAMNTNKEFKEMVRSLFASTLLLLRIKAR